LVELQSAACRLSHGVFVVLISKSSSALIAVSVFMPAPPPESITVVLSATLPEVAGSALPAVAVVVLGVVHWVASVVLAPLHSIRCVHRATE
jgi:hypothetical protein